ncbi:ankyrin repeat protein [Trichuris suis]|nr:ankyrin repeat protein [Trichuris suis]
MMLPYHSVRFVNASESAAKTSCLVEPSRKRRNEVGELTGEEAREFYENALQQSSTQADDVPLRKRPSCAKRTVLKSNSDTEVKFKCYAISKSPFSPQSRFLRAASEGAVSEMRNLLNSHTIDVNFVDDFGWSALMCASYGGHLRAVVFLLENAAIPSLKSRSGQSAADLATKAGHLEIYKILTQNERKVERDASSGGVEANSSKEGPSNPLPEYCTDCERPFLDERHITSTAHLVRTWAVDSKPCFSLGQSNVGYKLLVKGGWNQASGLGKCQEGKCRESPTSDHSTGPPSAALSKMPQSCFEKINSTSPNEGAKPLLKGFVANFMNKLRTSVMRLYKLRITCALKEN